MPWIALGTLVIINNDEGDLFQPFFAQSTPCNAWWSGAMCIVHLLVPQGAQDHGAEAVMEVIRADFKERRY